MTGPEKNKINFQQFILAMGTQAMVAMGEIPNPVSGKTEIQLEAASETIDILALIEEKTKGNLTSEEEATLKNLLHELRVRFVKKAEASKS